MTTFNNDDPALEIRQKLNAAIEGVERYGLDNPPSGSAPVPQRPHVTTYDQETGQFAHVPIDELESRMEIWAMIGQSNMLGVDTTAPEDGAGEQDAVDPRCFQVSRGFSYGYSAGSSGDIISAQEPLQHSGNPGGVSPGLAFAKALVQLNPGKRVILVPNAVGDTGFSTDLLANPPFPENTTSGWMAPTADLTGTVNTTVSGIHYQLVVGLINDLIQNHGCTLGGFIWHQGEDDAVNAASTSGQPGSLTRGDMYGARIMQLIRAFRENIVDDVNGGHLHKPFILGSLHSSWVGADLTKNEIQDVIALIPTLVPHTAVAGFRDLTQLYADGLYVHFEHVGLREMGRRYARAVSGAEANTLDRSGPILRMKVSGGTIEDVSGAGGVVTEAGSGVSLVVDADRGDVIRLDGTADGYFNIQTQSNSAFVFETASYTKMCWVKQSAAADAYVMSSGPMGNHTAMFITDTGSLVAGHLPTFVDVNGGTITPNEWTHLAVVFDASDLSAGANGTFRIYVNGSLVDSDTTDGGPASTPDDIQVGKFSVLTDYFDGDLDDLVVYNRPLSVHEIRLEILATIVP